MDSENIRTEKEIAEYRDEAFDRVWLVRKQNMPDDKITDKISDAVNSVCEKYGLDFAEPISDYDYGYWSGILSALRWVLGDEKDFLDT